MKNYPPEFIAMFAQGLESEDPETFVDTLIDEIGLDAVKQLYHDIGLPAAAQEDSPLGFAAFFELMHGSPLHQEGEMWVQNAYEAHEEGRGLAQECWRESGKTTVFSKFFLAFRIGKEPHKTNMIVRINDHKANETASAIAHIIENDPRWKMVYPHVIPDKDRGWGADGYYVKREDIEKNQWNELVTQSPDYPTFVGYGWKSGSIIGSRINGVLIVDDIHDEENTSSERQLASVKKFYTDTLDYCLMEGAWEIWNFTPWVENDVYAYIKQTGEYIHSKSPAIRPAQEGEEGATLWPPTPLHPDHPTSGDIPYSGRWWKLAWPEMWDYERLTQKYRKSGELGFARMILLDLEATKGINLKRDWLHEYPAKDIGPSWPVFFGIDYASTADKLRDKERDYFALAIYRAIPGGGIVLVDGVRKRLSKGEALQTTMSYWAMYPTLQLMGVENIGKGEEFYNDLLLMDDAMGRVPPLMPIQHGKKGKGERFENWLAPRFQMSRIWISDVKTPFIREFINEWLMWPNGKHDDCLDGAYMGAAAAEGYMPTRAERTIGRRKKKPNPFVEMARM